MTTQRHESWVQWWHFGFIAVLLVLGFLVGQDHGLKGSRWWYTEASVYKEVWVLWWGGLYTAGMLLKKYQKFLSPIWNILWTLTLILAFSSFWNLLEFINHFNTAGDLLYNHFLGAQRAFQGVAIYDVKGLSQSVNASPFVIALLRPFGGMTARAFLPWWLSAQCLFLAGFFVYGWVWLNWIWKGIGSYLSTSNPSNGSTRILASPGLPEFGVLVISTLSFNSFQRSWRLGQLDMMILLLVAGGCFHFCWYALRQDAKPHHGGLGGVMLALAIGLKLVPILALIPVVFWLIVQKTRALKQGESFVPPLALKRWKVVFWGGIVGLLFVVLVSLWGVGWKESGRFFENLPKISQGSTAGVNYAVVGRFAKYRDAKLRLRHYPLSDNDRFWLWPLRLFVLGGWLALAWIASASQLPWLMMLGLLALPTISPMCWDIYYIWCANFTWFLVFASLFGKRNQIWNPAFDPPKPKVAARTKQWLAFSLLAGSFYSMGLAGNSVIRSIHTKKLVNLKLPMWFDEARMLGYLLLVVLVVWVMLASRKAEKKHSLKPVG